MSKRIWVIDVPKDWVRRESRPVTRPSGDRSPADASPASAPARRAHLGTARRRRAARHRSWPLALAYALGPCGLFLGPGRGHKLGAGLGAGAIGAWIWIVANRVDLRTRVEDGALSAVLLLAGTSLVLVFGFVAWAAALLAAGQSRRFHGPRLRGPLRRLELITALGLLLPGLGHLLVGERRRAAWALAMVGPPLAAAILLGHASWLWHLEPGGARIGMSPYGLEVLFLASALILAGGILIWLVQALDAARIAARSWGRTSDGGALACALLVAMAVLAGVFRPALVGRDLDRFAMAMRLEDYRLIPLGLELGAMRLDPSMPLYAIRAADLCDELGWPATASELRAELHAHWSTYAWMLQRPAADDGPREQDWTQPR